jgi:GAF domain-containing protein
MEERFETLLVENSRLQQELDNIKDEITKAEAESRDHYARYTELEEQNETLANLYVAISNLHSTLQFGEVLMIIKEIIINLVGSESFAIFWIDEPARQLRLIASEGEPASAQETIPLGQNILSKAAQSGEIFISVADSSEQEPMACIPLKAIGKVVGVVVIYHLLAHKSAFSQTDFELFGLMADHAASSIVSSLIYSQVGENLHQYLAATRLLQMI